MIRFLAALLSATLAPAQTNPSASWPQLLYATFAGAGPSSSLTAFTVDSSGDAYIAGVSGYGTPLACTFLTKLNQTGTGADWNLCLPLSSVEALTVDASGFIYLIGLNSSSTPSGLSAMKLTPDTQAVLYTTQLTESFTPISGAFQGALSIAFDNTGALYITGSAPSGLQPTAGANNPNPAGGFLTKLDPSGTILYIAGLDMLPYGVAVDSAGAVWLAGTTGSECTIHAPCTVLFALDAAIEKLDAQAAQVLVSMTFNGFYQSGRAPMLRTSVPPRHNGWAENFANVIAVDSTGAAWVAGYAQNEDIPTTSNAIESESNLAVSRAPYIVKISPSGTVLYGSYIASAAGTPLEGFPDGYPISLALDGFGNPFVALSGGVLALSADGSTVLLAESLSTPAQAAAFDGNSGLYTASAWGFEGPPAFCPTTPGAYIPLDPNQGFALCASKYDLTQTTTSQFSYPLNAANPRTILANPGGAIAPGELLTVRGTNLPANPVVTFGGIQAPVLYSDSSRINTVVPFSIDAVAIVMTIAGVGSLNLPLAAAAPALFTADGSGYGQLEALNEDGGINSSSNPTPAGSTVTVYMTGAGAMIPPIADGALGPAEPPFPIPILPIAATVNQVAATVLDAYQAPGHVAGIVRVDLVIPTGTATGNAMVTLTIGGASYGGSFSTAPQYATIAVQ